MARYYLGLDNGGSKTKAALYDTEGNEVAVVSMSACPEVRKGGFVERDMDKLWQINAKVIREVVKKSGVKPEDIVAVAATGHGNGAYLIREDGSPAMAGIVSTDTRAAQIVCDWVECGVLKRIIPFTTQSLWAGQPVALLAWLKKNKPEILEATRWVLPCKDYIRYRLTGEVFGEITDMSALSAMDLRSKVCGGNILGEFGLEEYGHFFPPIKSSAEICGRVTKEAAAQTGLAQGTIVAGGLFDVAACCLATGVTTEDKMSVVAGTWSINSMISKVPVCSEKLLMTTLFCMDDYYITTEGSMTSAGNLEWFISNFLRNDTEAGKSGNVYDYCNKMVASVGPGECSILFLPFLYGTNVNADAKAAFIGIDGSQDKRHMIRAIYEGVVFSHMMHIDRLLEFMEKPRTIRISGGATESRGWVQIFADVLQTPIEVSAAKELGTLGAAMCAGVAAGDHPDLKAAAEKMSRIAYVCEPDPENKEIYQKKYAIYKALLEGIDPVWKMWRSL